jgi:hypothetical protein
MNVVNQDDQTVSANTPLSIIISYSITSQLLVFTQESGSFSLKIYIYVSDNICRFMLEQEAKNKDI